jgi:hypothetical protein
MDIGNVENCGEINNGDVQDGRCEFMMPLVLLSEEVQVVQGHRPIEVHPQTIASAS